MPPLPRSLLGREVKWDSLTPNHDGSTLYYKEITGVVIDTHWVDNTHHALITVGGNFIILPTTNLTLVNKDAKTTTT